MATVRFQGNRNEARRIALQLGQVLAGKAPDSIGVGRGFLNAVGFAALSDIKDAYVVKAKGGTDAMGIKWPPLKPATIANRRVGKRDASNSALIQIRERIRKRETRKALKRFQQRLPDAEARRRAAIVGGLKATRETGRTKVETLGGRRVEILRDTGVLLNSLSPGRLSGNPANYAPPNVEGADKQIFQVRPGEVIVGTTVKYASTHQHGDRSRGIPARPFLPRNDQVPNSWWDHWLDVANKALVASAALLYQGGRR